MFDCSIPTVRYRRPRGIYPKAYSYCSASKTMIDAFSTILGAKRGGNRQVNCFYNKYADGVTRFAYSRKVRSIEIFMNKNVNRDSNYNIHDTQDAIWKTEMDWLGRLTQNKK